MKKLGTIEIFQTESDVDEISYMATCKIGGLDFETYNGYDKIISALLEVCLDITEHKESSLFDN